MTFNVASHPKSSTEKAGVPITVLHRSQLETSPPSLHPEGTTNRKVATKAKTDARADTRIRVKRLILLQRYQAHGVTVASRFTFGLVGRRPLKWRIREWVLR